MDDIYDNLENYEDVNDVTELKNENKELKFKLEECSRAMNQMQKDFDKLNSEYKKLEHNYSSLLKTARAEIERKGEMIKNLNTEKDKLIINALQSKGKHIARNSNSFHENRKFCKDHNNYGSIDKGKQKQNSVESKDLLNDSNMTRSGSGVSSLPIVSNANSEKNTITNTTNTDKLLNIDKNAVNNELKENISKSIHKNDTPTYKTSSSQRISNRRKSMPSANFQEAKFSSDEESDKTYVKAYRNSPLRNIRHDSRDFRTDLLHSHVSSDSGRSRNSNHMEYNTQRHYDYDMKRHHRNYSPERYQTRYSDYNNWPRIGKSPPSDKYNRSKSRDRRYNYEREPHHHERHRHSEHSHLKHKIRNSFDEPDSKRQKFEVYSKCPSQDSNYISDREKEFSDRRHMPDSEFEQLSCQSPDYNHSDNHFPQHLIKEIRNTAATSLEDPRISSKRYILQSYNDQTYLTIPSARDVDILCVDKKLWRPENVKVPEALKTTPFSLAESKDYLNLIYGNMEDNESIESGEIQSLEDDILITKENCETPSNLTHNRKSKDSNTTDTGQNLSDAKVWESSSTSGFEIPQTKKLLECSKSVDKGVRVVDKIVDDIKKKTETKTMSKEPDTKSKEVDKGNKETSQHVQTSDKLDKANSNKQSILEKMIQDNIRTVEGDLELSDEESDSMELSKDIEEKKINDETRRKPSEIKKVDKSSTNSHTVEKKETDVLEKKFASKDKKQASEKSKTKETASSKKSSSKDSNRESGKRRRSNKKSESKEATTTKEQNKDKKDKEKKKSSEKCSKKNIPEQAVDKFSDLFGDTSSLITPDDLGLPSSDGKVQQDVKYASIFENTQDAVHLNIEDVKKAQVDTNTNFNNIIKSLPNDTEIDEKLNESEIKDQCTTELKNKFEKEHSKSQDLIDNYENSKAESSVETSNIVKTVIISTGVQPQREIDSPLPELPVLNMEKNNEQVSIKKVLSHVNALATSTPHKPILHDEKTIPSQHLDTINASNASVELSLSNVNNSLSFNTNPNLIEDVPDVRIIVRRKRKVIKKPT